MKSARLCAGFCVPRSGHSEATYWWSLSARVHFTTSVACLSSQRLVVPLSTEAFKTLSRLWVLAFREIAVGTVTRGGRQLKLSERCPGEINWAWLTPWLPCGASRTILSHNRNQSAPEQQYGASKLKESRLYCVARVPSWRWRLQ